MRYRPLLTLAAFAIALPILFQNCGVFSSSIAEQKLTALGEIQPPVPASFPSQPQSAPPVLQTKTYDDFLGPFASSHQPSGAGYDIVIVAGQSNAVGIGMGPFNDRMAGPNDSRIFQVSDPNKAPFSVVPAEDELQHWGYGGTGKYVGFGMAFARRYAATLAPNRKVLLVPAARAGSGIAQWSGTNAVRCLASSSDETDCFTSMIARTQFALNSPGENRIVAFLWHQGETDIEAASSLSSVSDYSSKLLSLFQNVRSAFVSHGSFPILLGEPARATDKNCPLNCLYRAALIDVMANMHGRGLDNVRFVSSVGLTTNVEDGVPNEDNSNPIHFSARSQISYGARFADGYRMLTDAFWGSASQDRLPFTAMNCPKGMASKICTLAETVVPQGSFLRNWSSASMQDAGLSFFAIRNGSRMYLFVFNATQKTAGITFIFSPDQLAHPVRRGAVTNQLTTEEISAAETAAYPHNSILVEAKNGEGAWIEAPFQ